MANHVAQRSEHAVSLPVEGEEGVFPGSYVCGSEEGACQPFSDGRGGGHLVAKMRLLSEFIPSYNSSCVLFSIIISIVDSPAT